MDVILWGLFFANKHSVFGDQTSLLTSAAHSNAARFSLSAVVPLIGEEIELDFDIGLLSGEFCPH